MGNFREINLFSVGELFGRSEYGTGSRCENLRAVETMEWLILKHNSPLLFVTFYMMDTAKRNHGALLLGWWSRS